MTALILSTLRRHPQISYFQGYHDIVSVILLSLISFEDVDPDSDVAAQGSKTSGVEGGREEEEAVGQGRLGGLAEEDLELLELCVERFSLHRIRDSMSSSMDPVMGYLRILHSILLLSSPSLTRFLTPHPTSLPLFSLSWILTLTAHDLPTLSVVSRLFDFLVAEEPVMVSYLGAGICELKRPEVEECLKEWGVEIGEAEGGEVEVDEAMIHHVMAKLPAFKVDEEEEEDEENEDEEVEGKMDESNETLIDDSRLDESLISPSTLRRRNRKRSSSFDQTDYDDEDRRSISMSTADLTSSSDSALLEDSYSGFVSDVSTPAFDPTPSPTPSPPPSIKQVARLKKPEPPKISIEQLVSTASSLYSRFPPTDPRVGVAEIMGKKSCVYTWALSAKGELSDQEAEAIVSGPMDRIVLPDKRLIEEEKKQEERIRRRRPKKGGRHQVGEWEITPTKVLVVAGVAGLVLAIWTSENMKAWVLGQARHLRPVATS